MRSHCFFPIALAVLICMASSHAKNYYVSPSGDDTHDGSISSPWQHIAFATCGGASGCSCTVTNANKVKAGDTLFIRDGIYHEHSILFTNSGTASSPIVIKSYPGETATVNGDGADYVFYVGGGGLKVSHLAFDGLHVTKGRIAGFMVGAQFITIKNCLIDSTVAHDNTGGVYCSGDSTSDIYVLNCKIVGDGNPNINNAGWISFGGRRYTIEHCDISNASLGIYFKFTTTGPGKSIIRNNFVHDNVTDGIFLVSNNAVVLNNIVSKSGPNGTGIDLWTDAGAYGGSLCRIEHNTVYLCRYAMRLCWGGYNAETGDSGARHDTTVNNILYGSNGEYGSYSVWQYSPDWAFHIPPFDTTDYNCYYNTATNNVMDSGNTIMTLANWRLKYATYDRHSVQGQPLFVNISGSMDSIRDFKLLSGNGFRAGSDGTDMGANVDSVGVQTSKTTVISKSAKVNRMAYPQSATSSHCSIVLADRRSSLISSERIFDIRGQRLRSDRVRPGGIIITVKP